jgi:hypothetical protein
MRENDVQIISSLVNEKHVDPKLQQSKDKYF